jgi:Cft2 family RNA processing exonuclease
MAKLTAISGLGGKGPACFMLETAAARIMLDLGYGPQPGLLPDVAGVGQVDALLLSHSHRDHAGGLALRPALGNPPVYASDIGRRLLRGSVDSHSLPLRGMTDVLGIKVTTGRSGHAPGGVWLHLAVGGGLLYMGDNCAESLIYANDEPPAARVVIADCSYGTYDTPLSAVIPAFNAILDAGPVLLPIPVAGRGPEIALHVLRSGRGEPAIDDAMRDSLAKLTVDDHACLKSGVRDELARLAASARAINDNPSGIMLAGVADAASGEAARLVERWEHSTSPAIVFTGYVPPGTPAARLTESGRASYRRWNVHPLLSENVSLARAAGAEIVLPAFGDAARCRQDWATAFAPARVITAGAVEI